LLLTGEETGVGEDVNREIGEGDGEKKRLQRLGREAGGRERLRECWRNSRFQVRVGGGRADKVSTLGESKSPTWAVDSGAMI
jgi:hypothetical protein